MTGWDVVKPGDEVHVIPKHDIVSHPLIAECACGPTCEPVPRGDGSFGWLYTHHSLDGREQHEGESS